MKNAWTGGQYSIARGVLGVYLAVHFAALIPWGIEVFSNRGVFPSGALSDWAGLLPNVFSFADSPAAVMAVLLVGILLSAMFAAGWNDRIAAVGLWYIWACLLGRNPLILNPSIPYVGWLLLSHLAMPRSPYGSLEAAKRSDPANGWRYPQPMFAAAWAILAAAYSYSGWTKLMSPSWRDGTAFAYILSNPLMRGHAVPAFLLSMPLLLKVMTWGTLSMELFFAPLACVSAARPYLWAALFAMHVSLLGMVDFADLSFGMIVFHLFTFDPSWVRGAKSAGSIYYDGSCALCHRFARFVLSEDRAGAFRLLRLGSEAFHAENPPEGLPESIVVLTQDGRWLTRSTALLHVLWSLGGLWRMVAISLACIPEILRDAFYSVIAQRRKALSLAAGPCPLPPRRLARRLA